MTAAAAAFPDRCRAAASRIHPSSSAARRPAGLQQLPRLAPRQYYTVWKRSSMGFQGTDGFCVYDGAGALAFRVDNYSRRRKAFAGELLLMDGQGAPLLALRPQVFSMHDQWNCYRALEEEEEGQEGKRTRSQQQQLFSMRKCSVLQRDHEAQVSMSGCSTSSDSAGGQGRRPSFWVDGCFRRRSCKIRSGDGEEVARVTRKKAQAAASPTPVALGDDVFSIIVQPGVDPALVMAFVVVLDRICWRPYTPMICSS
ncbi:hypothetical protein BS78_05G020100 [Paspalum vaginatum]|nr:hypothetical protein BS78_05G020100 [Paspalum vaginatum]